jgi:hypothetical protein
VHLYKLWRYPTHAIGCMTCVFATPDMLCDHLQALAAMRSSHQKRSATPHRLATATWLTWLCICCSRRTLTVCWPLWMSRHCCSTH